MFKRVFFLFFAALLFVCSYSQTCIPPRKGWWKFDNPADLTKAETGFGQALILVGAQAAANGPLEGNGATVIGVGSYYKMNHGLSSSGGGSYVNEYTLQYDFKISAIGSWHSFFQTATNNENDGDFFINPSGNIGVAAVGYSDYAITPAQWYRLVISVKNGDHFTCYLDGKPFLSGTTQSLDGRFSLEDPLLIFADEDGEDGEIYCSELAIWDQSLNAAQAMELGGFGHDVEPIVMTRIPYLQGEEIHAMTVCWHDTYPSGTVVKYGLDSLLALSAGGTSEVLKDPYCWHTVKLTGLEANTRYFYQVGNGSEFSRTFSFKTLPDETYKGKMRFILLSDTHSSDSTAVNRVLGSARNKISELYGPDIENQVNGIFHSGDIVVDGRILEQYTAQYFKPLSILSSNIPTMVVAGNHEDENNYFYQYIKLDDQSAFPQNPFLNEKVWSMKIGNTLFIGMNSNIVVDYGLQEAIWLDAKLNEAEQDASIDFVFLFMHHFPYSELWNVTDESIDWVQHSIVPVLGKYSKVRELHYGHTHAYERGTLQSEKADGDYSIICGGGGGGYLDPWNNSDNHDYPDIHISYSDHFFQILEIDIAGHSYQTTMYSIGDENRWKNGEPMDLVYRKINQPSPATPAIEKVIVEEDSVLFLTSSYSGPDSLMSVQLQMLQASNNQLALDTLIHWSNIYGIDGDNNPVDRNLHVNLCRINIDPSKLTSDQSYTARVRYRDHNLKWSNWSAVYPFLATGIDDGTISRSDYQLFQNYPNPFQDQTTISYYIPERCKVVFKFYDIKNSLVATIDEGTRDRGMYNLVVDTAVQGAGMYSYNLVTNKSNLTRKMVKIQ
jgi:hypothetical protein